MNRRLGIVAVVLVIVIVGSLVLKRGQKKQESPEQTPAGETSADPTSLGVTGNSGQPGLPSNSSAQNANQPGGVGQLNTQPGGAANPSGEAGKPNVAVPDGGQPTGANEPGKPNATTGVDESAKPSVGGYAGAPDTTGLNIPGSKKNTPPTAGSPTGQQTIPGAGPAGKAKLEQGTGVAAQQGSNLTSQQNQNASGGGGSIATATQKPVPSPTPDVRLKASPAEASCDVQWKQSEALFKVGADMAYMTNLSVQRPLAPDIATSHVETIEKSSSSAVVRDVAFSSDHPTGILVLSTLNAAPSITTSKDLFLSLCQATGGRALNSALFKMSRAKLLDIADETTKVGAGTFPSYHMKVEAAMLINAKTVTVIADIWMAKSKIGLPIKEVIKIGPKVFADHGSITINSQLAGSRKL